MVVTAAAPALWSPYDVAIDLSTAEGRKMYTAGVAGLEEKFDGSALKAIYYCQSFNRSRVAAHWRCTLGFRQVAK